MDKSIEVKNKSLDQYKKKFDTKEKDSEIYDKPKIKVENLLNNLNSIPSKIFVMGEVGSKSVRSAKKDENPLHGKDKAMLE